MDPEITVLMSCYNAEKYLSAAIESILTQTYRNFELLLINDGSTDSTLNLLRKYAEIDDRIKIIDKPNTGLTDSLNVGVFQAEGKWIARLDADDVAHISRLEKQLNFVNEHTQVILLGSGASDIDADGHILRTFRYQKEHKKLLSSLENFKGFPPHSSAFFNTKIAKEIGGYRPRILLAQDHDLWLRFSDKGQISALIDPLVYIRRHKDQISFDESGINKKQMICLFMGIVSHFIRKAGSEDPVACEQDTKWQFFYNWIEEHIDTSGFLQRQQSKTIAKRIFMSEGNRLVQSISSARYLIKSRQLYSIITDKIFDCNLFKSLAAEWCDLTIRRDIIS
jgi:glycosyltransferase involved in cell wall biosynthesis